MRYAKKEGITIAEAKKRASKLDMEEYARKAKKYVAEKDFSDTANEEMRLYNMTMKVNRLELLKAKIGLELAGGFDELEKMFGVKLTEKALKEFERQAGILGKTVLDNEKVAHAIVNASFHNATFSERIWMYQGMLKTELDSLLQQGLVRGKNPRELATHLRKRFGVSQGQAETLMITELARVQIEAQKQSFIRNGFEKYEYIACGNADVCETCKALDGKHFKISDMMPGENAPPMHPRCHCSTAAWEDSKEYEAWLEHLEKGGTTEEWNRYGSQLLNYKKETNKAEEYAKNEKILGKRVYFRIAKMNRDEYVRAKELWKQFDEIDISQSEKEYIYEEFDNNLTVEEKENALVSKAIGEYYYYAVNKGHNQYKIYKKVPIEPYNDIVDEVLSEMFGRDWKKQWEEIGALKKN